MSRKAGPAPIFNYRKRPRQAVVADPETQAPNAGSNPLSRDPAGNVISHQPSNSYGSYGASRGGVGGGGAGGRGGSYGNRGGRGGGTGGMDSRFNTAPGAGRGRGGQTPTQGAGRGNIGSGGSNSGWNTGPANRAATNQNQGQRNFNNNAPPNRGWNQGGGAASANNKPPARQTTTTTTTTTTATSTNRMQGNSNYSFKRQQQQQQQQPQYPQQRPYRSTAAAPVAGGAGGRNSVVLPTRPSVPTPSKRARSDGLQGGNSSNNNNNAFQPQPRPQRDESLRMMHLPVAEVVNAFEALRDVSQPFLFVMFGIVDSATVMDAASGGKSFILRDETGRIKCIFCEIDRPMPRVHRGQWYRVAGVARIRRQVFQCLSIRPTDAQERQAAQPLIALCSQDFSDFCLTIHEL